MVWDNYSNKVLLSDSLGFFRLDIYEIYNDLELLSGELKIYFYALNYNLDSASVFFANGVLSKNQIDFKSDGTLNKIIKLKKRVDIAMSPMEYEIGFDDTLRIQFEINIIEPITIKSFVYTDQTVNYESGLFFINLDNGDVIKYNHSKVNEAGVMIKDQLKYTEYNLVGNYYWNYLIPQYSSILSLGSYSVKPYFLIFDSVQKRFHSKLNSDKYSFEYDNRYLKFPSDVLGETAIFN
jgi:hypothetical protein